MVKGGVPSRGRNIGLTLDKIGQNYEASYFDQKFNTRLGISSSFMIMIDWIYIVTLK